VNVETGEMLLQPDERRMNKRRKGGGERGCC
jgi:hypothetical protein